MQTTVVQTIIYTLVTQLIKIVQQFITTTLTSIYHITPYLTTFILL